MVASIEDAVGNENPVTFVLNRFRGPLLATSQKLAEDFNSGKGPVWGSISHSAKAVRMTREEIDSWDAALGIRERLEQEEEKGNLHLPVLTPGYRADPAKFFDPHVDLSHLVSEVSSGTKVCIASHYLQSNPLVVEIIPYSRDATEFFIRSSTNIYPSFRHRDITDGGGQMFFDIYSVESGKPVLVFDKSAIDGQMFLKPYKVAGANIHIKLSDAPMDSVLRMEQDDEKVIGIDVKLSTKPSVSLFYTEDTETRIAFWQFARLMSYTPPSNNPRNIMNPLARPFYT